MRAGRLRVLLGAAPGVGKTFTMLEEGHRLRAQGKDVVVAIVETHGRAATARMLGDLPTVPRRRSTHRGVDLDEMDVDAVLERRPDVALVDELAHTNAPGSRNPKRWEDVRELLDAGISVITTVNIQHIASLNDVVQRITGVPQRETVPDPVLRGADQIEVVDLAPQALRERLAEGHVYPAERVDAALSNYFRLGNLTALRELALLWLADEVDSALLEYRRQEGIGQTWEARERVVVALTGGPEGETLLRRGARIAARSSGGQLLAVHIVSDDGAIGADPAALGAQRALVEQLGGTYHQVVGENVSRALVEFARANNATQLVLGASRRGRLLAALTGPGVGSTVIRESGEIDVHIVTHDAAGRRTALPRLRGGLTGTRRLAGFAVLLVAAPLLTWGLVTVRSADSITSDVLAFQLLVVVVALIGGIWPALVAAVACGVLLDFFFIAPLHTVSVADPLHLLALLLYVLNGVLVSYVVDQAARRTRAARRALAEAELVATVSGSVLRGGSALSALVDRAREAFGLRGVRLIEDGRILAQSGEFPTGTEASTESVGARATLAWTGPDLDTSARRILRVIVQQLEAAIEHEDLSETARRAAPLEEADRVRTALLAAVGHDLRRPLAAATTAVGTLRATDLALSEADRRELLDTAEESLASLSALVTNLLDASRLQAGALGVRPEPTDLGDALLPALDELGVGPAEVELDVAADAPAVQADPVLLQRVLVNLLSNALRYSPPERRVRVGVSAFGDEVQVRVVDHGPGIDPQRRDEVFAPFQRLGDVDNAAGLGLGLALARGFVEGMAGTLEIEDTPGGGLTMVVSLPAAREDAGAGETDATGGAAGPGAGGGGR